MTSTDRPIMTPATIDSNGKPGTAGTTSGVVWLDEDDAVTVTVLTEVPALDDVLLETWLVLDVDIWDIEVVGCDVLVTEEVLLLVAEEVVLVSMLVITEVLVLVTTLVVDNVFVTPPVGGSRWNIRPREAKSPAVPTANPSVPESKYRPCNRPLVGKAGIVGTVFQTFPS
jgi:hypothetical protein